MEGSGAGQVLHALVMRCPRQRQRQRQSRVESHDLWVTQAADYTRRRSCAALLEHRTIAAASLGVHPACRPPHTHHPPPPPTPEALTQELIKSNNNGYRGSQRLNKDAQAPLNFGPPWDFNGGWGAPACLSN